jgi:hypothetical protein
MTTPFPFRKFAANGSMAMRDGLVFVVFMPAPHSQVGAASATAFERYLAWVGSSRFTLVHDRGEQYRQLTPKKLSGLVTRLRAQRPQTVEFQFSIRDGDEGTVPEHYFAYSGGIEDAGPAETSHIEVWFPTEYPDEIGLDAFLKGLLSLAQAVPFSSGYASLALNYLEWADMGAVPYNRAIAMRHPGVDVHNTSNTGLRLGDGVRGAYWLTLLGTRALARLEKDAAAIRQELGPEIEVLEIENGVAIRAGERPLPGDVNENDRLPLIRKVAALVAPIQVVRDKGILFGTKEEWVKWQRRHLL